MSQQDKKKPPSFEQALERLEGIVEAIEHGKIGLEESIAKYEEGMGLIQHCRKILAEAELKIQKLQAASSGELEAGAFGPPAEEPEESAEA